MRGVARSVVVLGVLGVGACAVNPPTGPSFVAMPGEGKPFEQFQSDDLRCRQTAMQANGNVTPGQGATESGVGSAVAGTALGAAAGALLGSAGGAVGGGAAIGAGVGLLAGSAVGAGAAQASSASLQRNYDVVYAQCMAASGERVPNVNGPPPGYGYSYGYPPPPPYGYYGYYGPPVVYAPSPVIGFGFGFGGGFHRRHYW
jgi:Glycine-zipper domain